MPSLCREEGSPYALRPNHYLGRHAGAKVFHFTKLSRSGMPDMDCHVPDILATYWPQGVRREGYDCANSPAMCGCVLTGPLGFSVLNAELVSVGRKPDVNSIAPPKLGGTANSKL